MSEKHKFALYIPQDLWEQVDMVYTLDGCGSRNQFIEKALRFYLCNCAMESAGNLLPVAVTSAIEGRLGMLEDRLSSLMFKQAVELDMMMNILAEGLDADEESLRHLRGRSINNVKRTNGRLTFESTVKNGSFG